MKYVKLFFGATFTIICYLAPPSAFAQCANSPVPSCTVYESCFSKYCPCNGDPNEYFESYGGKYCKRFLEEVEFSPSGKKWRDSTLICLQEVIVPKLNISENPTCDCAEMKKFAFDSHVACYTQPETSMCNLPITDLNKIRKLIENSDLFSSDGWQQMKQVAKICEKTAPNDGRKSIWKALVTILSVRQ